MSANENVAPYVLVVDTEQYAGNFERQMCAYMTGCAGECGVGEKEAEMFIKKYGGAEWNDEESRFAEIIMQIADEHGCARPVNVWPTPGWFSNGMGGEFRPGQEKEAEAAYKKSIREYAEYSNRVNPMMPQKSEEDIEKEASKPMKKYPAYNSVGIFFSERPSDEDVKLMTERAIEYAANKKKLFMHKPGTIKITGFRLIAQEIKETELWSVKA